MSKTRIFISSTCYDLAPVRENLREHLLKLGHEPLLSEYPSFPVNPDDSTIFNCKKNVEMRSDILLVIIGGRRGALDTISGKSITNLEYEAARGHGIPCFVFINRRVEYLLPVWRKNPNADFTPDVDCQEVFKFIERIRAENRWVFTFEKTAEIHEHVSFQLSVMLRELLARDKAGDAEPEVFVPEGRPARPEARSTDYYRKFAEKLPRNAIQEAWAYMEGAVNYGLITHNLDQCPDITVNLQAKIVQLIGHGDVTQEAGQRILGDFYHRWATARVDPNFKLSPEAVFETIAGLLKFSAELVEKCDQVWAIRHVEALP